MIIHTYTKKQWAEFPDDFKQRYTDAEREAVVKKTESQGFVRWHVPDCLAVAWARIAELQAYATELEELTT